MSLDSFAAPRKAIQNMRITFWGIQGSCANPMPYGAHEYSRRLAFYTLAKTFEDMGARARDGRISIEELLGGPATRENIEKYQQKIGLPDLPIYGGETTCIEVETADGNVILLDAGTGLRRCSLGLVDRWKDRADRTLHIFCSHEHLDHRAGLTFSRFCYVTPNPYKVNVYGSYSFLYALDQHYGLFSRRVSETTYVDDPVDYTTMFAQFKGIELRKSSDTTIRRVCPWSVRKLEEPVKIGGTTITPFEVYHVIPACYGYRIDHGGKSFVFCTDHELRRGPDPEDPRQRRSIAAETKLREICRDVDVAYIDGQYFMDEYQGKKGIGPLAPVPRIDWGHSCVEDVIDRALSCNIRRTFVGHHDPERSWQERVDMARKLAEVSEGKPNRIEMADADMVIDL